MKHPIFFLLLIILIFIGCNKTVKQKETAENQEKKDTIAILPSTDAKQNIADIQKVIREMLSWADSKKSIDLLPVLSDPKDSLIIGFNLKKHRQSIEILKKTTFFTDKFIENYNQIVLTLDKKLRNKEFDNWHTGDLPTFNFASGVNPWTLNQDIPYDKPNPWDWIEIEIIHLNGTQADAVWKWGKTELAPVPVWENFRYKFKTVQENEKWKIDYLQGFDYKESTK